MGTMLYTVLAASGGYVAGAEVAIGAEVALTDAEVRYEVDAGTVAPTGREPVLPVVPALLGTDLVETRRGRLDRAVVLAAVEAWLLRDGGSLADLLDVREVDLAGRLTAQGNSLDAVKTALLGDAPAAYDSLGKVATILAPLVTGLATATARTQVLPLARAPLPADLEPGVMRAVRNTTTGRVSLWVSDGTTVTDLLDLSLA